MKKQQTANTHVHWLADVQLAGFAPANETCRLTITPNAHSLCR
jgi:hypothetical protein